MAESPRLAATSLDLTGFAALSENAARRNIAEDRPNETASAEKRGLLTHMISPE